MAILDFVRRGPRTTSSQDSEPPEYVVGLEKVKGEQGGHNAGSDDKHAYKLEEVTTVKDPDLNPGELTFEEGASRQIAAVAVTDRD